MKKLLCFVVPCLAAGLISVSGCGLDQHPAYSPGIEYGVRQDPIVTGTLAKVIEDRYEPDRPGVLPLMKFDDIDKPDHPMNAQRAKINDGVLRDPLKLSDKDRRELEEALRVQFGTPANPTINAKAAGIDDATIQDLQLDDDTLAFGSTRYRIHCLHCHGVPGDGRGPTARWINPHPRDFRAGMFKFQSVDQASDGKQRPPSRGDLLRTLRHGIEGTAMPNFNLLSDKDLEGLVSYVIHLSIRGRVESDIVKVFFEADAKAGGALVWNRPPGGEEDEMNKAQAVQMQAKKVAASWKDSSTKSRQIVPVSYKELDPDQLKASVLRGQQLFIGDEKHPRGKAANCKQCHDDYGRQARFKFDDWGTLVRPNNFTIGVFRGGRRPVDLYYRIHSGINGSGMNNFGATLPGEDIWDLVNFVSSLSYPGMRQKLGLNID